MLEIRGGEDRARCSCCITFRLQIEGLRAPAQYCNRVRAAVLDRLRDATMRLARLRAALRRDCPLNLRGGLDYDYFDGKVRQIAMPGYPADLGTFLVTVYRNCDKPARLRGSSPANRMA